MQVTLQDRERLNPIGKGLEDIMDALVASVQGGWDIEHLHNGRHGNITATSVYAAEGFIERDRVVPIGVPIPFTPTLGGTFTNDQTASVAWWSILGTTLTMGVQVFGFSAALGAAGTITMPPGFGGTVYGGTQVGWSSDNGVARSCLFYVTPASTTITAVLAGGANWAASVNNSSIFFTFTLPVTPLHV